MAAFKVDYFFDAQHVEGWTETFYLDSPDITSALRDATGGVFSYVTKRLAVLHAAYSLVEVRVSDEAVLRDSLIKAYIGDTGQGTFGDKTTGFEQAWDGILCRGQAGAASRRAIHLRGVPSGQMDTNGKLTIGGNYLDPFDTWRFSITNVGVGFKLRKQTPTTVDRPLTCNIIGGGRSITLAWAARPAGILVGTLLNVKKVQDASSVNGRWKVASIDATSATMVPKRTVMFGAPSTAVAVVQTVALTYPAITDVIPERGVKLNTGKSLGQPVGRRTRRAA